MDLGVLLYLVYKSNNFYGTEVIFTIEFNLGKILFQNIYDEIVFRNIFSFPKKKKKKKKRKKKDIFNPLT